MKLWILERFNQQQPWDCANGFVVRANDEEEARRLCSIRAGDEGMEAWTDPSQSSCVVLFDHGNPEVILRDFTNG